MAKRMIHNTLGRSIRTVTVDPYGKGEHGQGPTFTLHCFDTGDGGLAYELWQREQGKRTKLFEGADYHSGEEEPANDANVALLFAYLTIPRSEKAMATWTPEQKLFVKKHGEPVYKETYERFRAPLVAKPRAERKEKESAPVVNLPQHRFRISSGQQNA
jgi:hypothetical protein